MGSVRRGRGQRVHRGLPGEVNQINLWAVSPVRCGSPRRRRHRSQAGCLLSAFHATRIPLTCQRGESHQQVRSTAGWPRHLRAGGFVLIPFLARTVPRGVFSAPDGAASSRGDAGDRGRRRVNMPALAACGGCSVTRAEAMRYASTATRTCTVPCPHCPVEHGSSPSPVAGWRFVWVPVKEGFA
jgi:hypothetical protein